MPDASLDWGTEALLRQLEPLLPGLSVEVMPFAASTNTELLDRARVTPAPASSGAAVVRRSVESHAFGRRATDLQPCLLIAEHQTAGRGRHGRPWQSAAGASLTFSLGAPLAPVDWSGLSLAVGVAICDALAGLESPDPAGTAEAPSGSLRLALKWPNDLWLMSGPASGRKLGGVLIETVAAGARRLVVIGVGLNMLPFDAGAPDTGQAALSELDASATAPAVLARIALPLVQALKHFERDGFAPFADRFAARDLLRGHEVRTTLPAVPGGVACGVSPRGALRVRTDAGIVEEVSSGEVSVRLARTAGAAAVADLPQVQPDGWKPSWKR